MTDPTTARPERPIRAPRGTTLSGTGRPREPALRMRSVPSADGRIADST